MTIIYIIFVFLLFLYGKKETTDNYNPSLFLCLFFYISLRLFECL